jgi:hypothetical protein
MCGRKRWGESERHGFERPAPAAYRIQGSKAGLLHFCFLALDIHAECGLLQAGRGPSRRVG